MRSSICLCFSIVVAASTFATIIFQLNLKTRQPTSETLARQPTPETLARQPTPETLARQPPSEEQARQPPSKEQARQLPPEEQARQLQIEEQARQLPSKEQARQLPPKEQARQLPPEEQARQLPSEEKARQLPPEEQARQLPSKEQARQLHIEAQAMQLPSETLAKQLPPEAQAMQLPYETPSINPVKASPEFHDLPPEPLFEEATHIVATPPYVVPNIVHFIWFAADDNRPLSFINYVSILSAHLIQKPQLLLLHCNHLPSGKWWRKLWRRVPVKIVHREPPRFIFNQPIKHIFHAADLVKYQLMETYGGIYLDTDVIVVNSLDPLRVYQATLGKEKPPKLIAGIMIGAPKAEFFRLVYESYRGDYRPEDWDYNCARRPYELFVQHPHLLHVETYKLTTPDFIDRHLLFNGIMDWHPLYVVHIMAHVLSQDVFEPRTIRTLQTTFGEVMRYIYYGSPAVRPW